MKRIVISAFLGTLSLAATAQPAADQQSVRIPAYSIETPAQTYQMMPSDLDFYKGAYSLSNGDTLTVSTAGHHIYAAVGDRPLTELVAASSDTFVAIDKQLKMTLNEDIHGRMRGELLMATPAAGVASGGQVIQTVAIR